MTINIPSTTPLIIIVDESDVETIETIDAGAVYTEYLHRQLGTFEEKPLNEFVDIISTSINPVLRKYSDQIFEYLDLREVDDIYGQVLKFRIMKGSVIGSNKHRFRKWDILFAKIMPSLANKKICIVTNDVQNAVASTEFIVIRRKPDSDINLFYLFRALRSDHFTRQAVANVTGATGRQRINPTKLLELRIPIPPKELQERIGTAVEREFTLRTLAAEQTKRADDETGPILGPTTLRIERAASSASRRRKNEEF